jgi:hypothetical protein
VVHAAVHYSETPTYRAADRAFLANRHGMAAAIVRWVFTLPPQERVKVAAEALRGKRWRRVAHAAHVLTDALLDAEASGRHVWDFARFRVAAWRFRRVADTWARRGTMWTSPLREARRRRLAPALATKLARRDRAREAA